MSGSPKHSFASAQAETERRLRAEREAREQAERERLAAEARARAEAQRVEVVSRVVEQAEGLSMAVAEARTPRGGRFMAAAEVADVERQLRQAVANARASTTVDGAREATRQVSSLTLRFAQLRTAATATAERAAAATRQLSALHTEIDRAAGSPDAMYLPPGAAGRWRQRATACEERLNQANTADDVRAVETELTATTDQVRADAEAAREAREAVNDVRAQAATYQRAVRELLACDLASFVPAADRDRLTASATDLSSRAQAAGDRDTAVGVARAVSAADADRTRVHATADAARLSAHLAAEERTAAGLRGELNGLAERSAKFDSSGRAAVTGRLDKAASQLAARQLDAARAELNEARIALDAHTRTVGERFAAWQQARDAALAVVASARGRVAAFSQDPTRQRWVTAALADLGKRLTRAEQMIAADQFAQATADGQAAEAEAVELAAKADRLEVTWQQTEQVRAALAAGAANSRHDAAGVEQTTQALTAAQGLLRQGNVDAGERQAAAAAAALARHLERVRAEAEKWERDRDATIAEVDQVRAYVLDLRGRTSVGRWAEPKLTELLADVERAAESAAAGNFTSARATAGAARAAAARAATEAEADARRADVQAYIADGIHRSLDALGYDQLTRGAERPDDPRSAVIVQAVKSTTGEQLVVAVEFSGRLEYEVGEHQKRQTVIRGQKYNDCEAEAQIEWMHQQLLALGVETSPLDWDGKPTQDMKIEIEKTTGGTVPPITARPIVAGPRAVRPT